MRNSTDFLRRSIAPVDEQGGITLSSVSSLSLFWWVSSGHDKRQCSSWWCAACGTSTIGKPRTESLVIQDNKNRQDAKVCRAHAALQGTCDNLITRASGKPTGRWRQPSLDGRTGLAREKFVQDNGWAKEVIAGDNYAKVKFGDLEKDMKSKRV